MYTFKEFKLFQIVFLSNFYGTFVLAILAFTVLYCVSVKLILAVFEF